MKSLQPRATIDCETRSACPLRTHGSWRYSLDPTTDVLCFAYRLPYWAPGRTGLWHPAFPQFGIPEGANFEDLYELFEWVVAGELVEAHNAWFERGIWVNQMQPRGWPVMRWEQWRCSAAKAAAHALPRALDDAAAALHLPIRKDAEGSKLMKKMTKPRKPLKKELTEWSRKHAPCKACSATGKIKTGRAKALPCSMCAGKGHYGIVPPFPTPIYHESPEMLLDLFDYCRQDVLTEEALSDRLYDLNPQETLIYLMDQNVNERGYALDREAITTALELIDGECVDMNAELQVLTNGAVEKATQREKMMTWFEEQGLTLYDTRKDTIDALLESEFTDQPPHVMRALELMRALGRSSTAKFVAMSNWICPDDRAHGGLLYHGAGTGRWSGQGVQPHNFVKGSLPDMEAAWEVIKTKDVDAIRAIPNKKGEPYGDVMKVLSEALRGAIVAGPGKRLYVADYAAIEARVLLWLANDRAALQVFRDGKDIYLEMATAIYGYPCFDKKLHEKERSLGKPAVLGLGYQMGASKFVDTAASYGVTIDEEFSKVVVDAYREKFWRVKQFWREIEDGAIEAVLDPGCTMQCNRIEWFLDDGFLFMRLPSGRLLAYPEPRITDRPTPWGDVKPSLSFKGINPYSRQWSWQTAYGGLLVENATQAVARDLMAEAMYRCEQSRIYAPVLSVHDEMIAEADADKGDVKEFEALMAELPAWADGCPVAAEGWTGFRYRK
jgi:DNA polymerase